MAPFAAQLTALSKVPPEVFPYLQAHAADHAGAGVRLDAELRHIGPEHGQQAEQARRLAALLNQVFRLLLQHIQPQVAASAGTRSTRPIRPATSVAAAATP